MVKNDDLNIRALQHSHAGFRAVIEAAKARFEQAKADGNVEDMSAAGEEWASWETQYRNFTALANEGMAQDYQKNRQKELGVDHKGDPLYLTEDEAQDAIRMLRKDEREVAIGSFSGATPQEKLRSYVENKAKLHHMRRTGEYRQTTEQTG